MNAPFKPAALLLREADLVDVNEFVRLERFVAEHPEGTPFHRPTWLHAVERGTGNRGIALVAERGGELTGFLPLSEVHSPLFGRLLASTGFGVAGGVLALDERSGKALLGGLEEIALRRSCPSAELRGGMLPKARAGWKIRFDSHCGFAAPLAEVDEAQLTWIPRKQRAEVRKGLANDLDIAIGSGPEDRAAHYAVYAESVRNLGTPVFPRGLFEAVLDGFGADADILTVRHQGNPVASVLSLYHGGAVMPYWGGGTWAARRLRANDRMYFELMLHARRRISSKYIRSLARSRRASQVPPPQ